MLSGGHATFTAGTSAVTMDGLLQRPEVQQILQHLQDPTTLALASGALLVATAGQLSPSVVPAHSILPQVADACHVAYGAEPRRCSACSYCGAVFSQWWRPCPVPLDIAKEVEQASEGQERQESKWSIRTSEAGEVAPYAVCTNEQQLMCRPGGQSKSYAQAAATKTYAEAAATKTYADAVAQPAPESGTKKRRRKKGKKGASAPTAPAPQAAAAAAGQATQVRQPCCEPPTVCAPRFLTLLLCFLDHSLLRAMRRLPPLATIGSPLVVGVVATRRASRRAMPMGRQRSDWRQWCTKTCKGP